MTIESKVPVAVGRLEGKTIVELRCSTLSTHITVRFRNLFIIIAIHELILQRAAVGVIFLLIDIVGIRGISHHLATKVTTRSLGDISCLDVIVLVLCLIETGEPGILKSSVEAQLHTPGIGLDRHSAESELKSLVGYRAYIGHQLVAEVRAKWNLNSIEKIVGISDICIHASAKSVLPEAEIKTDVICQSGLPLDCRIIGLWGKEFHIVLSSHII